MQFTLRAYFHAESVNKLCIFFFNSRKINLKKKFKKNTHSMLRCKMSKCDDNHMRWKASQ